MDYDVTFQHEDLFKEDFFAFAKMLMVSELIQVISGWKFNSSMSPSNDQIVGQYKWVLLPATDANLTRLFFLLFPTPRNKMVCGGKKIHLTVSLLSQLLCLKKKKKVWGWGEYIKEDIKQPKVEFSFLLLPLCVLNQLIFLFIPRGEKLPISLC